MLNKIKRIYQSNKAIVLNILGAFGVKGGSLLINVLLLPAYIGFFEDQVILGVWYTILSILNWIAMFDLGLGHSLRNKLPGAIEKNDRVEMRQYISTTYFAMGAIALAAGIVGMLAIPHISWNSVFNVEPAVMSNAALSRCMQIVFSGVMVSIVLRIVTSILYALQLSAVVNSLSLVTNGLILAAVLLLPSRSLEENLTTMSWVNCLAVNLPCLVCSLILFGRKLRDCVPSLRFFRKPMVREIVGMGMTILWLNLIFMVVSAANELLITNFAGPQYVVEFQVYYKIFNTAAMVISLALTPIWSAVTRASARGDYNWIRKVYKLFLGGTVLCLLAQLCVIPLLQWVVDLWLGEAAITVRVEYALAFAASGTVFVLHNVNTSIGNGLSYFKVQMIWMTLAAAVFVPLSWVLVQLTGSWIGIVLANILAMLPYEVLAPIKTMGWLRKKQEETT